MFQAFDIHALRYDAHKYVLCARYSSQSRNEGCMDPTGPFSWTFHKKLPNMDSSNAMAPDEATIRALRLLWYEVFIPNQESGGVKEVVGAGDSNMKKDESEGVEEA